MAEDHCRARGGCRPTFDRRVGLPSYGLDEFARIAAAAGAPTDARALSDRHSSPWEDANHRQPIYTPWPCRTSCSSMPDVFVSHAAADAVIADAFVDTILKLGCGLKPEQIFYSSGEDTGVPSGSDLIHHVRDQVGDTGLLVAIITPMFQTRPVCVAELGAAWSRTGNLFPVAVPGMARTDMEGVLAGMSVRYLDDSAALDELHDRISEVTGGGTRTTTWGRHKEKWLANVGTYVSQLQTPETVSVDQLEKARDELAGARAALADSEAEVRELKARIEEYRAAENAEERAEALLPKDETKRFETLTKEAIIALQALDPIVREAIYFQRAEGGMPWPNPFDDSYRNDAATKALQDGTLAENSDEQLVPDDEVTVVADAQAAVQRLHEMLASASDEFDGWFRDTYGAPPQLHRRQIWDALLG